MKTTPVKSLTPKMGGSFWNFVSISSRSGDMPGGNFTPSHLSCKFFCHTLRGLKSNAIYNTVQDDIDPVRQTAAEVVRDSSGRCHAGPGGQDSHAV